MRLARAGARLDEERPPKGQLDGLQGVHETSVRCRRSGEEDALRQDVERRDLRVLDEAKGRVERVVLGVDLLHVVGARAVEVVREHALGGTERDVGLFPCPSRLRVRHRRRREERQGNALSEAVEAHQVGEERDWIRARRGTGSAWERPLRARRRASRALPRTRSIARWRIQASRWCLARGRAYR